MSYMAIIVGTAGVWALLRLMGGERQRRLEVMRAEIEIEAAEVEAARERAASRRAA